MSLRFYMDHHIPSAITSGLRARGVECITAAEDQANHFSDDDLLSRSTFLMRVLVTMDDDFLGIASQWIRDSRAFGGVIYAHPLRITIGQAISELQFLANAVEYDDMRNRIEFIPL